MDSTTGGGASEVAGRHVGEPVLLARAVGRAVGRAARCVLTAHRLENRSRFWLVAEAWVAS